MKKLFWTGNVVCVEDIIHCAVNKLYIFLKIKVFINFVMLNPQ
jgi:hypothetical protein